MKIPLDKNLKDKGIEIIKGKLKQDNRRLLLLAISGSHAWGLAREDSDIDFRGIYQDPTIKTMGLHRGADTVELSEGLYDFQLYEIEKFLRMLCNHNGNMVNLLALPKKPFVSFLIPWVSLCNKFITKKLRFYYRGYAEAQRKRAMSCRGGKALIYTYREMFSGLWTMQYGYMEYDFIKLWEEARIREWYKGKLLDRYFPDPTQEVTDEGWHEFYSEWNDLCVVLDDVTAQSSLPETFDGVNECNELLLSLRLFDLYQRIT